MMVFGERKTLKALVKGCAAGCELRESMSRDQVLCSSENLALSLVSGKLQTNNISIST